MKIIYNNIIPFNGFSEINIFGFIFVRKGEYVTPQVINHEQIHTAQMRELLYIFFYLWYLAEWLLKLCLYGKKAYENISFEREAYDNDNNSDYLQSRKKYAFLKKIWQT